MKCVVSKKVSAPKRLIDSKAWCPLSFYLKYYKREEWHNKRELENLTLIDLYIVIMQSVPCSGRKYTSEKMSAYSIQN